MHVSASVSASFPSKFQDLKVRFPGPGNFTNTIPGLSRRCGIPVLSLLHSHKLKMVVKTEVVAAV